MSTQGKPGAARTLRAIEQRIGRELSAVDYARVLKAPEAAQFLGIDVSTLRHLSCRRALAFIRTGKRGVAYQLLDLIAFVEERREAAFEKSCD